MPEAINPRDGTRIFYQVEGDGPPLVMHHGYAATGRIWRQLGYTQLLKHDLRLILIDARGHGRSDKPHEPSAYSIERRVSDVIAVLDCLAIPRVHFFGYSLGGATAYGMAAFASDRLASVSVGGWHPGEADDTEALTLQANDLRGGMDASFTAAEQRTGIPIPDSVKATARLNDAKALRALTLAWRDTPSLLPTLDTFNMPALIFAGELDPNHDPARRAAGRMPNGTFVSLDGLDHMTAGARGDLVAPLIADFVARIESPLLGD